MRTQRQRLALLAFSIFLLFIGYEGIIHDGWGLFGKMSGGDSQSIQIHEGGLSSAPATRPSRPALPIWGETSICGRDRLEAFLERAGSDLSAREIIFRPRSGPLSADPLDPTLPSGKLFPAGNDASPRIVFAIPLKHGEGQLWMFEDARTRAWADHPEILFAANDIGYRRTAKYLFMGGTPETLLPCSDDMFKEYEDPSLLAIVKGDLKILRQSPAKCNAQVDSWTKMLAPMMTPATVNDLIGNRLDSAVLAIRTRGDATFLHTSFAGRDFRGPDKAYLRPAFPKSCFARFEYVFSSRDEMKRRVNDFVEFAARRNPPPPGMEEKMEQGKSVFTEIYTNLLGDAASAALEPAPAGLNIYTVMQFDRPQNVEFTLQEVCNRLRRIIKSNDENVPGIRLDYDDGGFHVLRLLSADKNWYCDFIQAENKTFACFSRDAGHHVAALAALKPTSEAMHFAEVSCDLAEAKRAMRNAEPGQIPAALRKLLDEHFDRGNFSITVDFKDDAAVADIELPASLSASLLKLIP